MNLCPDALFSLAKKPAFLYNTPVQLFAALGRNERNELITMSASREKKNRQGETTLTEKQRLEQTQAAESKKKGTLYAAIGIVLAVAIIALLVWDSGVFQRSATAVTIDGEDYSVADMDYFYNQTLNNFVSQVTMYQQQYGIDMGYDTTKSPAEQTYATDAETGEVTTYKDYFMENALTTLKQAVALSNAAKAAGHTLSESAQASITSQNQQLDQMAAQYGTTRDVMLRSLFGTYATEKVFTRNLEMTVLADDYLTAYQEGIDTSEAALEAYYKANPELLDSYTYRYAYIDGQPETKLDDAGKVIEATEEEKSAAMADAKDRAEKMLAAVKSGEEFDKIAQNYVAEISKEAYATKDYTLRTKVLGSSLSTTYQEWLTSQDRAEGDVEMFENNGTAYVLVQYVSRERDDICTVDVRHILVTPKSETENATQFTEEEWAAAETEAKNILDEFTISDGTAEAFGKLAEEHSEDGRKEDGSLYTAGGLYTDVKPGDMVEAFNDWIFDESRTEGETGLVKTNYGWHVMYFQGVNRPLWQNSAESALLADTVNGWLEELTSAVQVVEADGMAKVG